LEPARAPALAIDFRLGFDLSGVLGLVCWDRLLGAIQDQEAMQTPTVPEGVEMYLQEVWTEIARSTHTNRTCHLKRFLEFLEQEGIEEFEEIDPMLCRKYKLHRRDVDDVRPTTLRNQLTTFRLFLRWAAQIGLIDKEIPESIIIPTPNLEDKVRDTTIEPDRVQAILDYCSLHEPFQFRHVTFGLIWHTGFRVGTVVALDLDDYHPPSKHDLGYLQLRHRPDTGTPLKNKKRAEREVNLADWVSELLDEYIRIHRIDVTDEFDREPLFTSASGRAPRTLIRRHVNALTRPCHYSGSCPHGRELSECEARDFDYGQRCPSSVSPHPVRRGSITSRLNEGWVKDDVSARSNVSSKVLDTHYDARSETEKRRGRAKYFGNDHN
jgi:site-specific recombinase XerD